MRSPDFSVLFATNQDMDGSIAHKRGLGRDVFGIAWKDINFLNILNDHQQLGKARTKARTYLR